MSDRKRLILTIITVSLLGIVTGLFLRGGLPPSQAAQKQYDERTTTSKMVRSVIHSHDNVSQHEHVITTVVTITETTPHGYFHDFAAVQPGAAMTPTASAPVQPANEVWASELEFRPNILTVPVGATVTWVNKDGEEHSVTSTTRLFDAGLAPGIPFSYTFTERGTYEYYCIPHTSMLGTIIVQ